MAFDPNIPNDSNQATTTDYNQGYENGREDGFEEGRADADYYGANGNGNGNGGEPLGLPRGSVRSILALELVTALIGLTAYLVVANPELGKIILATLSTLAVAAGTWYFATRPNVQK